MVLAGCAATGGCARAAPRANAGAGECPLVCGRAAQGLLVAALWGCEDECRYHCMWECERLADGVPPQKYHGKWPFLRVGGCQEIVSAVASLGNLAAHLAGYSSIRSAHDKGGRRYGYMTLWTAYFLASVAAWTASAAFHTRDTLATERLDYGAANAVIATGVWSSLVRCTATSRLWVPGAAVFLALLAHLTYMNGVKFDYGWNMAVCVAAGLAQSALWARWVGAVRHPGRRKLWLFLGAVNAAMLLEVLDFPPLWQLLDAHALWHLATVPLVALWYAFLRADIAWEASRPATAAANKQM